MKYIDRMALVLLFFSGLNWGLIAIFNFNLIDYVFGQTWIDYVLYFLFGASAIYGLVNWKNIVLRARGKV